jgi:hypothetical protein
LPVGLPVCPPARSHTRRRGGDDSARATDLGLTAAAAAGRTTRSPPEGGRRFVSTATGLGYVASATGVAGAAVGMLPPPGSPAMSPALRSVLAAAGAAGPGLGTGRRREVHALGSASASAAAGSAISSSRRRESRGDALMLDRFLPQGDNGFVIVVGEEDIEDETDSEGLDGGSAEEEGRGEQASVPAALQAATGSESGGGRAAGSTAGSGGGERPLPQHQLLQRQPGAGVQGLSIAATFMHLNSGRIVGGPGGHSSLGGGGGGSGPVLVARGTSGPSLHL